MRNSKPSKREHIEVWRDEEFPGVEFRQGTAVKEPYPRHWHEEYQLCLITEGGGSLHYRGMRRETPAASLFIVHPGEVHSNETSTGCSFRSIYIEPRIIKRFGYGASSGNADLPFFGDDVISERELVNVYRSLFSGGRESTSILEREFRLQRLVTGLCSHVPATTPDPVKAGNEPAVVRRLRNFIIDNHARGIFLSELEGLTGLSGYHLTRVFSSSVGLPPHAFQTHVRIVTAKALIRRGLSFADAAVVVGFADQSHFHRHFLRLMKVTPGEYFKDRKNVQY